MEGPLRISSSNVGMESSRQYVSSERHAVMFSVTSELGMASSTQIANGNAFKGKTFGQILSGEAEEKDKDVKDSLLNMNQGFFGIRNVKDVTEKTADEMIDEIRVRTITFLLNLLGGTSKKGMNQTTGSDSLIDKLLQDVNQSNTSNTDILNVDSTNQSTGNNLMNDTSGENTYLTFQRQNFSYHELYTYAESESTSFKTQGTVMTADGREISFGIDMAMSRSFQEAYDVELIQQNISFCDPLVINLDSNIAEVSDQKFLFDVDHDGIVDEISQLSSKSGYLALDKNGDGIINDGSELFGTSSGDGFKDLAQYDTDGDGWIDEDDEVWSKLLIWSKDEEGNDKLYHLSEKGVGAIGLKNTSTEFSLNSSETNQVNARIRNTGIFLYENGSVGTVQHLDLAK